MDQLVADIGCTKEKKHRFLLWYSATSTREPHTHHGSFYVSLTNLILSLILKLAHELALGRHADDQRRVAARHLLD